MRGLPGFIALVLALGCAHPQKPDADLEAALARETPEASAEFRKGMEAMASDSWEEATKIFEHVKTKYPFSDLAPLAELKLADTRFQRDQFEEAAEAYKAFGKLHPNHPRIDYAAFRAAVCEYKAIPSDFFILPPPAEKEQTHVKGALQALNDFLAAHPKSQYAPEAEKLRNDCRQRLADHEIAVADFYDFHDRPKAVVGRLETVLRDYPGIPNEPQLMLRLIRAYVSLKQFDKGHLVLKKLTEKYPNRPERSVGEQLLKSTPVAKSVG